ncbi:hypothetical protein BOTNAR_0013g00220 [Botryotinia narcissicola]|uniref:Uncharacterized protein n=1 Tax=Botryotinia narcissicola TaxID=278944 RepID=A0A4Z1JCN7_9HELO|nr:hypothetical protein BOTNAR_0013g00220 [Botryotinia narcissicola]
MYTRASRNRSSFLGSSYFAVEIYKKEAQINLASCVYSLSPDETFTDVQNVVVYIRFSFSPCEETSNLFASSPNRRILMLKFSFFVTKQDLLLIVVANESVKIFMVMIWGLFAAVCFDFKNHGVATPADTPLFSKGIQEIQELEKAFALTNFNLFVNESS